MIQTQHLPNNLRSQRTQASLRQIDVANALGLVSSDRVSHWENGTAVPSIVNLFKLSVLYKVPPEKLYLELFRTVKEEILNPTSPDTAESTESGFG